MPENTTVEGVNLVEIVLPKDEERIAMLQRKYAEYEGRQLEAEKIWGEYNLNKLSDADAEEPESPKTKSQRIYKFAILGALLQNGRVDKSQMMADLDRVHGGLYLEQLDDAFNVIKSYAEGTEGLLNGGTGLK